MLTLTFHGHACFVLEADGRRVILDPFLMGNPAADIALDGLPRIDAVLLSHGHSDHLGDAIPIAPGGTGPPSSRRSSSPSFARTAARERTRYTSAVRTIFRSVAWSSCPPSTEARSLGTAPGVTRPPRAACWSRCAAEPST